MAHNTSGSPPPTTSPSLRKSSMAAAAAIEAISLDSPVRTTPLHTSIPSIKLPSDFHTTNINPLSLQPFTDADLKQFGFEKTRNDLSTKADVERAREEAIKALRDRLEDREAKTREIDREIDEKEKIREVERKVYRKKMSGGRDG